MYEATIALGLAACEASLENLAITGEDHFRRMTEGTFTSLGGPVIFDEMTGTRVPSSALYKVTNFVKESFRDEETGSTMVRFNQPITDLFLDGVWSSQQDYLFNDGTTMLPIDFPLPMEEEQINLPMVIGLPVAALVLLGILIFLFYEHKRKENDSVWKVGRDELKFSDPPEVIGRGTFGLVLLAEYRGTQVAVKRVIPKRDGKTKKIDDLAGTMDDISDTRSTRSGTEPSSNIGMRSGTGMKSGVGFKSGTASSMGTKSSIGTKSGWLGMTSSALVTQLGLGSMVQRKNEATSWNKMKQEFMEEMRYLSKLRHPCVTTVMGKQFLRSIAVQKEYDESILTVVLLS